MQGREFRPDRVDDELWGDEARDEEDPLPGCGGGGEAEDVCAGDVADVDLGVLGGK